MRLRSLSSPPALKSHPTGPQILVIEKDDGYRYLLGRILERKGYRPLLAANSYQALSLFQSLDKIRMVFAGVEFHSIEDVTYAVREIRPYERDVGKPSIPIVAGTFDEKCCAASLRAGMNVF